MRLARRILPAMMCLGVTAAVWVRAGDEDTAAYWEGHAGCALLGHERDRYMRTGRAAEMAAAERRSALTIDVVAQLAAAGTPKRSRAWPASAGRTLLEQGDSIDDFLFGAMDAAGVAPAEKTTDAEYLRRVTIDLIGRIPTQAEALEFLGDRSADKRERLVERLLSDPRWADRWAMFYGDLFRNTLVTAQVNRFRGGRDAFHLFLLESLRANRGYDAIARDLITASGAADGRNWPRARAGESPWATRADFRTFLDGATPRPTAASYLVGGRTIGGPVQDSYDAMAVNVARDLLGIAHMDCVMCHDGAGHLDDLSVWGARAKRAEAWGLAAFFEQVFLRRPAYRAPAPDGRTLGPRAPVWMVERLEGRTLTNRRGTVRAGEYALPTTGGNRPDRASDADAAEPVYPFGGGGPGAGESHEEALARLLTADPQFARAAVNYVWRELFGRGIVDPPDQFDPLRLDPENPPPAPWELQPSHPELLDWLASSFAESGFDLRRLMQTIVLSDGYQLSSRYDGAWSAAYDRYFARHQVRRLSAEALYDSITIATGTPENLPMRGPTTRALGEIQFAMQLPDVQDVPAAPARRPIGGLTRQFLDAYFRGDRQESPRSSETSVLQALQSMNNELTLERMERGAERGALAMLLEQNDEMLVTLLYLRTLGRAASPAETAFAVDYLEGGPRRERAADLQWALLNKADFVFNY